MITERRKEVYSWFENLIAAYENYLEFAKFPGSVDAKIDVDSSIIRIRGLKNICEYANIPYRHFEVTENHSTIYMDFSDFKFYDIMTRRTNNMSNKKNIDTKAASKEVLKSKLISEGDCVRLEGTAPALAVRLRIVVSALVSEMILSPTSIEGIVTDGITDGLETLVRGEH